MGNWMQNIMPVIVILLAVLVIASIVLLVIYLKKTDKLSSRIHSFMKGEKAETYEGMLQRIADDDKKIKIYQKNNREDMKSLQADMQTAYRKMGLVKYNAFPGMAGKMSASLCLLNNDNNGVLITVIHGPEGCYTYVKEIMNGKSISPLTKEDEDALQSALEM